MIGPENVIGDRASVNTRIEMGAGTSPYNGTNNLSFDRGNFSLDPQGCLSFASNDSAIGPSISEGPCLQNKLAEIAETPSKEGMSSGLDEVHEEIPLLVIGSLMIGFSYIGWLYHEKDKDCRAREC